MKKMIPFLLGLFMAATVSAQHSIILKSGEKLSGVVMSLQDDVLTVAINRELKEIDLINVSSIFFNEYVPYDGSFQPAEPMKTIKSGSYTIKYQMKDRKIITPPKISNATENRGIVVVEVMINRQGKVMKAKAGGVGSTTSSEYLLTKAKFAAQGAQFDVSTKGPVETHGTIIITY